MRHRALTAEISTEPTPVETARSTAVEAAAATTEPAAKGASRCHGCCRAQNENERACKDSCEQT